MEVHSPQEFSIQAQIDRLKNQHLVAKKAEPFQDPIREFARASKVESLVSKWLTYPIEERKRLIKANFLPLVRLPANPGNGIMEESDDLFASRQMERWRALCVIIQEESRAAAGNRSAEVAAAALKLLFPEHNWKSSVTESPKA